MVRPTRDREERGVSVPDPIKEVPVVGREHPLPYLRIQGREGSTSVDSDDPSHIEDQPMGGPSEAERLGEAALPRSDSSIPGGSR